MVTWCMASEIASETQVKGSASKVHCEYGEGAEYVRKIDEYLDRALEDYKGGYREISQERSFYLNSSDSLEVLNGCDFSGEKVMTVSGSGEFAHVFINKGAREVVCFDISLAAGFYTELRHQALCALPMAEYISLFGEWNESSYDRDLPFINGGVYEKIKASLSEEARYFFDKLLHDPKYKGLLLHGDKRGNSRKGFSRTRRNEKYPYHRYVGDILKTEEEYAELQKKAREVVFTQVIADANGSGDLTGKILPDVVYMSNIGYDVKETVNIAKKFMEAGAKSVLMTATRDNYCFEYHRRGDREYGGMGWRDDKEEVGAVYYENKKLVAGSVFRYRDYDDQMRMTEPVDVEVMGIDGGVDYGILLKIGRREKTDK